MYTRSHAVRDPANLIASNGAAPLDIPQDVLSNNTGGLTEEMVVETLNDSIVISNVDIDANNNNNNINNDNNTNQ